jgi:hypothetical protein
MSNDPIRDLRDELTALRNEVGVTNERVTARLDRMEADIERLEGAHRAFINRSWAILVLVITAALGGLVSIVTRQQ